MNYDPSMPLNQEAGQMYTSDKSKTVAGILGILVGSLGVHRMYMGYIGIGVLQLVLTLLTLGMAGLWGFIEGVLILVQDDWTDAHGRLLKGNAIKINDKLVNNEKLIIDKKLFNQNYLKLSIGKKRHIKIELT